MKRFYSQNKYCNKKIFADGEMFDSQMEYVQWLDFVMLEKAGEIKDLQRQVKFEIIPKQKDERAAYYIADFVYTKKDGQKVICDLKSKMTRKLHDYILKRKLVKYKYPDYEFLEIVK